SGWLSRVSAGIQASEYRLSPALGRAGWSAPNRAQGLRALWYDGTVEVEPRDGVPTWRGALRLAGVVRGGSIGVRAADAVDCEIVSGDRIEWRRDGAVSE